jgi:hypothetical protein
MFWLDPLANLVKLQNYLGARAKTNAEQKTNGCRRMVVAFD